MSKTTKAAVRRELKDLRKTFASLQNEYMGMGYRTSGIQASINFGKEQAFAFAVGEIDKKLSGLKNN